MYHNNKFRLPAWYVYCVLGELVLIYPTYLIMMESSGISPFGLASLLAIWAGTTLVFEVPSGVFGDLFNRKTVLIAGAAIEACAFVTWLLFPNFWGFALGFTIWSFGSSLASGTAEAYLYEALDDQAVFQKVYGRTEAVSSGAVAVALLTGGILAETGFTLPLLLSSLAPIGAAVVVWLFLPPASNAKTDDEPEGVWVSFATTLRSGIKAISNSPRLLFLILAPATLGALTGVLEEFVGVIFAELSFSLTIVGLIYAGVWFARTIGSLCAEHLPPSLYLPLLLSLLGCALLALFSYVADPLWVIFAMMFLFGVSGIVDVIYGAQIQNKVDDDHRATVTSIGSMALEVNAIVGFFLFGYLAQADSGDSQWFVLLQAAAWIGLGLSVVWMLQCRLTQQIHDQDPA
ncbi:MAG: MFS transporter [Pseudomonadales bacterium]|nr:MFS transporter [Pseudomonadales bacterium]